MNKLSEKYFNKLEPKGMERADLRFTDDEAKLYGQICALEAQQTLLVSNPETFPQDRYIDKLAEIVNALEQIKIKENL